MPQEYEPINITTGEIKATTEEIIFRDINSDRTSDVAFFISETGEQVIFDNAAKDGNLVDNDISNDKYVARQVGTHLSPDNKEIVSDTGEETPV